MELFERPADRVRDDPGKFQALIRMIDEGTVPTQIDLEKRLFCGDSQ